MVIIVHWHAPDWCESAVKSILKSEGVDVHVTVINNGGELSLPSAVTVVDAGRNRGFAGGANLGLEAWLAGSVEHCFVASHDLLVAPDTFRCLLDVAARSPGFGILGPWFTPRVARVGQIVELDELVEFQWLSGSGLLITRECAEKTGFFDEDFGSYVEDEEYCLRARDRGFRVGAVPSANASNLGTRHSDRAFIMMRGNEILLSAKQGRWRKVCSQLAIELVLASRSASSAFSRKNSRRAALRQAYLHGRAAAFGIRQLSKYVVRSKPAAPATASREHPRASA